MNAKVADYFRQKWGSSMTEEDAEFLRDAVGFINFAVENGLPLLAVLDILSHDINGILVSRKEGEPISLAAARKDGFSPKVTGYSKYSPDQVGEPANLE